MSVILLFSISNNSYSGVNESRYYSSLDTPRGTNIANSTNRLFEVEADSTTTNKIDKVYNNGEIYTVEIELSDYSSSIRLLVFNMLGNMVKTVHNGQPLPANSVYQFDASNLPNGIYLCILEGPNFRDAEKFIISR